MFHKGLNVERYFVLLAVVLAFCVILLGAYTRLTDAGLGCPDWPGCYGHLIVPSTTQASLQSQQNDLQGLETRKAWTEMIHRYAAGTLVIIILLLNLYHIKQYFLKGRLKVLPLVVLLLIIGQALLGMWTVTLKLLPIVVMAHLLGGFLIFSLLMCWWMQLSPFNVGDMPEFKPLIIMGIVLIFSQIALGGWVSANYAGVACIGFPKCNGQWMPHLQLTKSFYLFSPVGANYQGGLLEHQARATIQFIHRCGAFIVLSYILFLTYYLLKYASNQALRIAISCVAIFSLTQIMLGILNVVYLLPIKVAVAHNGIAALLLASSLVMFYFAQESKSCR